MKPTLEDIKNLVDILAEKINAPKYLLPTYGQSIDGAHPHIEIDKNGQLYYAIIERGEELKRDFAVDTDDLLYRVFADITFSMASDYEVKHRIETEDFRRQMFANKKSFWAYLVTNGKTENKKNINGFCGHIRLTTT
jgi:hypothetical protein